MRYIVPFRFPYCSIFVQKGEITLSFALVMGETTGHIHVKLKMLVVADPTKLVDKTGEYS